VPPTLPRRRRKNGGAGKVGRAIATVAF